MSYRIQKEGCIWCRTRSGRKDDRFGTVVSVGGGEWVRERELFFSVGFTTEMRSIGVPLYISQQTTQ